MPDRRSLTARLLRLQAMIWSVEDPHTNARLKMAMAEIERQLAELNEQDFGTVSGPLGPSLHRPR